MVTEFEADRDEAVRGQVCALEVMNQKLTSHINALQNNVNDLNGKFKH